MHNMSPLSSFLLATAGAAPNGPFQGLLLDMVRRRPALRSQRISFQMPARLINSICAFAIEQCPNFDCTLGGGFHLCGPMNPAIVATAAHELFAFFRKGGRFPVPTTLWQACGSDGADFPHLVIHTSRRLHPTTYIAMVAAAYPHIVENVASN